MTTKLGISFLGALLLFSTGYASSASTKKAVAKSAVPEEEAPGAAGDEGAAQESEASKFLSSLPWTVGPGTAKIGNQAEIKVPEGTRFTGSAGTRKMLEMMHNPTGGNELGLLTNDELDWFVIFEFEDIGYVKDADKEKLDGQAILESLREGNEAGNDERKKRGWLPSPSSAGTRRPSTTRKPTTSNGASRARPRATTS